MFDLSIKNKKYKFPKINNFYLNKSINLIGLIHNYKYSYNNLLKQEIIKKYFQNDFIQIDNGYFILLKFLKKAIQNNNKINIRFNSKITNLNYFDKKITFIRINNSEKAYHNIYLNSVNYISTFNILKGNSFLEKTKNKLLSKQLNENLIIFIFKTNKLKLSNFTIYNENFHTTKKILSDTPSLFIQKESIDDTYDKVIVTIILEKKYIITNLKNYINLILETNGLKEIYQSKIVTFDDVEPSTIINPNLYSNEINLKIKDEYFNNLYLINNLTNYSYGLNGVVNQAITISREISKNNIFSICENKKKKIMIQGANFKSIIMGCLLKKKGYDVIIYEKKGIIGGKHSNNELRYNPIPNIVLIPNLFSKICQKLEISNQLLSPNNFKFFFSNKTIEITNDINKTLETFEAIEEGASLKLYNLLEQGYLIYTYFIQNGKLPSNNKINLSYNKKINVLKNQYLKIILNWHQIFMLNSDSLHSSIYLFLNYIELVLGSYSFTKSSGELLDLFYQISNQLGVQYHLSEESMNKIISKNKVVALETNKNVYPINYLIESKECNKNKNNGFLTFYFESKERLKSFNKMNLIFDVNPENQIKNQTNNVLITNPILLIDYINYHNQNQKSIINIYIPFNKDLKLTKNIINYYEDYVINKVSELNQINFKKSIIINKSIISNHIYMDNQFNIFCQEEPSAYKNQYYFSIKNSFIFNSTVNFIDCLKIDKKFAKCFT